MLKLKRYPIETNLCLLAITKGQSISIPSTYIVFVTKMQKRQTRWNGFALIGKRYHNQL